MGIRRRCKSLEAKSRLSVPIADMRLTLIRTEEGAPMQSAVFGYRFGCRCGNRS
jgi:hypothetical protein